MVQALLDRYVNAPLAMLRTRTAREAGIVMSGTFTSAVLRFFITMVLAKFLAKDEWGTMVVFIALVDMLSVFCDSGLHPTLVRFMAINEKKDVRAIVRSCLGIKLVLTACVTVLLCAGRPIFMSVEKIGPEYRWLFPLAVAAGLFLSFNTFCMAVLQGRKSFGRYAVVSVIINVVRAAVIGGLAYAGVRKAFAYYGAFFVAPALCVIVSAAICWTVLAAGRDRPRPSFSRQDVLRFAAPLALLQVVAILYHRSDIFMLKAMASSEQAGAYALAYQVAYIFPLLTQSLFTALLPKVMTMKKVSELVAYRHKILRIYPPMLIAAAIAAIVAPFVIAWIFGDKYTAALPVIRIIILGFGVTLVVGPLSLIFYALERQIVYVYVYSAQILMLISMNMVLIPRFEAVGAAITAAVTGLVGTIVVVWATGWMLRRRAESESR
jgi:O-antigen/teichoic acid export membrane protein